MKNTQVLGALGLSLALVLAGSQCTFAQGETQAYGNGFELAQEGTQVGNAFERAIANALAAQTVAQKAQENGSVRGKQINEYISGLLEHANGDVADMAELTEALNDAADSTQLLLNAEALETATKVKPADSASVQRATRTVSDTAMVAKSAENMMSVPTNPDGVQVKSAESTAKASEPEVASTIAANTKAAVVAKTNSQEEPVKQPQVKTVTPEQTKITTAEAKVENQGVADNVEVVELPKTGEAQNQIGKIITIGVAAVIAAVGAVAIALKVKRDA